VIPRNPLGLHPSVGIVARQIGAKAPPVGSNAGRTLVRFFFSNSSITQEQVLFLGPLL